MGSQDLSGRLTLISDGATAGAPLLLDCRMREEDTEDSPPAPWGEGEGVRVGEVLLEVVEVPDGGLLPCLQFLLKRVSKTNT